jgi:hypothetical protein
VVKLELAKLDPFPGHHQNNEPLPVCQTDRQRREVGGRQDPRGKGPLRWPLVHGTIERLRTRAQQEGRTL